MKKRFKKLIVLSLCLLGTFCIFLIKQNNKTNVHAQNQNIPVININKYHVTWIEEFEEANISDDLWGYYPFISNGNTFETFQYVETETEGNLIISLFYDNVLVYSNGWLKEEYRVMSFVNQEQFIVSTEVFTDYYEEWIGVYPFTIGYNIQIVLNNVWYRFTNNEPVNNTGDNRIWLNYYTTYFIPPKWLNTNMSIDEFETSRNYWNNLYVTTNTIEYHYSFEHEEYGFATIVFDLLSDNGEKGEWSAHGGMGTPQDQVIRIADTINYDLYVFLMQNGYFGTYTELTFEPNDKEGFGNLIMSIANTPIEIISNLLNVKLMGVNLYSVFCGIITIFLAIFVIKRIT